MTSTTRTLVVDSARATTNLWGEQQSLFEYYSGNVDVYNTNYFYDYTPQEDLYAVYMNSSTFRALVPPGLLPAGKSFNDQANSVFSMLNRSFMVPAIDQVQKQIDAGVSINVLSGQVDLIVDALCSRMWVDKLPWKHLGDFNNATRYPIVLDPTNPATFVNGFVQEYDNFRFISTVAAGHMEPLDQPVSAFTWANKIIAGTLDSVRVAPESPEFHAKSNLIYPALL
jgi:hypothetical protein